MQALFPCKRVHILTGIFFFQVVNMPCFCVFLFVFFRSFGCHFIKDR